jgi:hypothetical protein
VASYPRREGEPATKFCRGCLKDTPIEQFRLVYKLPNTRNRLASKKLYRFWVCKVCQNKTTNEPKKKYKTKEQIERTLRDLDKMIVLEAMEEDPELMKSLMLRIGAQRVGRLRVTIVQRELLSLLERRVKQCKSHGQDVQASYRVWRKSISEMDLPVPPERLINMERLGLLREEPINGSISYLPSSEPEEGESSNRRRFATRSMGNTAN